MPLNRLIADDFVYLINHSGARIVCAHSEYLDAIESIRAQLPNVLAFVALEGTKPGWLDYETLLAEAPQHFQQAAILEIREIAPGKSDLVFERVSDFLKS